MNEHRTDPNHWENIILYGYCFVCKAVERRDAGIPDITEDQRYKWGEKKVETES